MSIYHIFQYFFESQKIELVKNIERIAFWTVNDDKLHFSKLALLSQIHNLDISITGKGFFILNRQFLASVSEVSLDTRNG